ncbi:response regulator [Pedobacter petrophilus]|uniref:Response regulator n=1 Tax=Pedobacter petrophilus TaxID=1908241 RepID=A0A7K0G391_9SPHI|nr:response regulator [Pedobacter petrophilus]MRX77870.1 response regulator [Pedobacter petrophilus]
MKLSCIILDDEPLAQEQVEAYISECEELVLIGKASSMQALERLLKVHQADILFLDIKFRGGDISQIGRLNIKDYIIIVITAYSHKHLTGYNLNFARDILFKPFSLERFKESLNKVISLKAVK